jgi:hypothetical protein
LAPFARTTELSLTTESAGEDAALLQGPTVADVGTMFDEHPDGIAVHLRLDLDCLDADGNAFAIGDGAWLLVGRDNDDERVELDLWLEVDIYACVKNRLGGECTAISNNSYDVDEHGFVRPEGRR